MARSCPTDWLASTPDKQLKPGCRVTHLLLPLLCWLCKGYGDTVRGGRMGATPRLRPCSDPLPSHISCTHLCSFLPDGEAISGSLCPQAGWAHKQKGKRNHWFYHTSPVRFSVFKLDGEASMNKIIVPKGPCRFKCLRGQEGRLAVSTECSLLICVVSLLKRER